MLIIDSINNKNKKIVEHLDNQEIANKLSQLEEIERNLINCFEQLNEYDLFIDVESYESNTLHEQVRTYRKDVIDWKHDYNHLIGYFHKTIEQKKVKNNAYFKDELIKTSINYTSTDKEIFNKMHKNNTRIEIFSGSLTTVLETAKYKLALISNFIKSLEEKFKDKEENRGDTA